MGALVNIRHERFARQWVKIGVAARAYLKAGYEPTTRQSLDVNASRLLRHDQVQRRIGELKRQMAARNRITVDSLIEELDAARDQAADLKQPSVVVSAIMSKARLTGLLVDRKESGAPGEFSGLQSEADVMATVERELGADAAAALAAALTRIEVEPEAAPPADDILPPPLPTNEGSSTPN